MIPKIIHYCWFGKNPLDKKSIKCIESWKKYFPDYEIREWNEDNFDITRCTYAMEAYKEKKWAFVSDYVRFKVLYKYGGVYFDTDVEVVRNFDNIISEGNYMGCENANSKKDIAVNPGVGLAAEPGMAFYKEMIDSYESDSFYKNNGELNLYTIVERTTDLLMEHGLINVSEIQRVADINIYPREYFCPINMETGKMEKTENTYSIHWYSGSWETKNNKFRGKVYQILNRYFGEKCAETVRAVVGKKQ